MMANKPKVLISGTENRTNTITGIDQIALNPLVYFVSLVTCYCQFIVQYLKLISYAVQSLQVTAECLVYKLRYSISYFQFNGRHLEFSTSGLVEKYSQYVRWITGPQNILLSSLVALLSPLVL